MSAKTVKTALGLLQDDPESADAWQKLREDVRSDPGMTADELRMLLEAARRAHEARREYEAVARLFEIEADAAQGAPRQLDLLAELGRMRDEELLDDEGAEAVHRRILALRPDDATAQEAIERSRAKRAKWRELVERYLQEASHTPDPAFHSSLLVGAAETTYRFGRADGGPESLERVVQLLVEALRLDPKNRRAQMLLERILRDGGRWEELARAVERFASDVPQRDEKVAAWVRLGRVLRRKLDSRERAAAAYEKVLELAPGHTEASSFLSDYFTSAQMWDRLIAMYEEQLAAGVLRGKEEEFGATLQIAMIHWRMRGRAEAAEPWFEKLRKLDPGHPGMLTFFREWCSARGESQRLVTVLTDAQRALAEGTARSMLVAEIAKLAEEGANAHKAIEQWRALFRQDPRNTEARDALKRLYRQTASYSALTDLLRQELERIPPDNAAARLLVLRDVASIYRDHVKSDSALVAILTQIVQLDPVDVTSVRELARVYEALQRWRDLLATQARQADLEPDPSVKAALWRAIGRRWLDQFSNMQNATEAYERLRAIEPADREAIGRLRELYVKRRAYKALYDLLAEQAEASSPGPERRELWMEMAKLAAERLDMGSQAAALYKRVLDEDPQPSAALDALEKQAERDKDFATVAEALERRVELTSDPAARLVVLQKLGTVYSERLHDSPMAMSAWRRVLSLQPGHAKALRVLRDSYLGIGDFDGLTDLYAHSGDWESLAEVLSGAADRAAEAAVKIDLSFRCAHIYTHELHAPDRAFRAYERVLSVAPNDGRAAAALVPLYEKDEKWGRLPALYEILLGHAGDLPQKLHLLDKLVQVTGQQLQDRAAAFRWATRSYELAPDRPGALEALERAARLSDQWAGFAEIVASRLGTLDASAPAGRSKRRKKKELDGADDAKVAERRGIRAKLAEVYAGELGRVDEAVQIYRGLVEEDESDDQAVQALDRILRESDRGDDLRWLFDVRIERANTALKIELLSEWAMLEEEAFGAPERAIALYRRTLQVVPHHGGALRALARLLRARGDAEGAAEVIATDRDQREGADRAVREIELAKLFVDPLRRYTDALAACERALELAPNDPGATAVVEQLLPVPETRARAAAILERAYDETGASRPQADVLEVLIATTAARDDRVSLYGRLADVRERKLADSDAAFDVIARAASEYPADLALWDRLAVLAARTGRVQALVDAIVAVLPQEGETGLPEHVELDLAERVATLFDEKLDDPDSASPYLERMLARQPNSERAFQRLKQILTMREEWSELGALYERAVGAASDPRRRTELLAEVALVAEEITGDKPKAIGYYERILEVDPGHEQAVRSLDALYEAEQRWDRLAELLERRLGITRGEERLDLQQRLGTLRFTRLGDAAGALSYLDAVLQERPAAAEARQLLEQILDVPELRSRAAVVLESVYASRDDVPELVRVLEIHLEFAEGAAARRDLLRRIAQLRDERLRDDAGALEAFARLLPLDPDDAVARGRMLEIARRAGAYERAAGVLMATAAAAAAPLPRADIFMDVAHVYESHLGEPSRAEAIYRQVLQLAPEDASIALPACRSLERIYGHGDSRQLCEILRVEVGLETDAAARRELYGRLGELCETVLDDPRAAIEAWRARLDEDPADVQALSALDRLYEHTGSWRELVEVLRKRERMVEGPAARRELLVRVATTLAEKLSDSDEAVSAYRLVIDDFGADRASLSALAALYQQTSRWRELAETLEADMALADSPEDKLALLARLGEVRQSRLGDLPSAIDAYRRALAIDLSHARSRAALEAMLDDPVAQREVAAILRPLYEADALHDRLLRVLEIEAEYAESVSERLATVARSVDVAEGPLGAPARAFSYAARGLREAVAEPDLPAWIERAERLAALSDKYAELVQLLRSSADEIADPALVLEVILRVADLARQRLGDSSLAKQYYARALELQGDERRALVALESLYEETGEHAALLEIVKRRADLAESDEARRELLFKQARLCDGVLGDSTSAIAVYEQILDLGLDAAAVAALERLYARARRWDELVALYERQIGVPGVPAERRAALRQALGEVLERGTLEVERAFDEYASALAIDPKHPATIAALERLMTQPEHAARAAVMLEPVYVARLDWRRVMATLEARLAASQEPQERKQILRRLSKLHEEQEENYAAALETTALLLGEEPTDETTWSELERLARVANAQGRLAEAYAAELEKISADEPATAKLARRTGELFEAQGNVERALVFYRRAHAFEPERDEASFTAIDRLLRAGNRPADRVRLYRDSLDYKNDPRERLLALQTIARIQQTELHDDAAAVDSYRAALEIDDANPAVLDALSTLYERGERWSDLAEFIRTRAEQSALAGDEARFRTSLAKLLIHKLGDAGAGLDELQTVVDLTAGQPGGPGAETIAELEALVGTEPFKSRAIDVLRPIFERADDWRRLIALNEQRLAIAADDGERIGIWRENAFLWQERGKDPNKAFDAIRDAWTLDPEDGEAREVLDRIAASTGRWDDLAQVYEAAIARSDGATKRELLSALAHLHDGRRDDPRRALDAWERLFALDETDLQPLEEMDALATLLSDWQTLVRVLRRKAELVSEDEYRASTWRRIGEALRDMLDDDDGAIVAFERAVELEPTSGPTIDQLIALHEQKKSSSRLVELYRRRVELCEPGEDDLRFSLLSVAASRYEVDLGNRGEAIECLAQALVVKPGDAEVLRRLDALYTQERLWPELLENLKLRVDGASDEPERLALRKRVAALYAVELQDPQSALETYREILQSVFDEESLAAIRAIGESRDDLRLEAADALEPVLRKADRHKDVAAVLELRLRAQTETQDRTRTLRALAAVAESSLADLDRAQSALIRALAEEPGDTTLHGEIERLAGRAGAPGWQRYADALQERASSVFEGDVAADLYIRLGRVAEERLDDPRRSANAYAAAADRLGDDPQVLRALDRLLERLDEKKRLADVLERRIAVEPDARTQADLSFRLGTLQIGAFRNKAAGLATLRQGLERVAEHTASQEALASLLDDDVLFEDAFAALETVYRTTGRSEDVAKLYERRVGRAKTTPERTRLSLDLARVLETTVGDRPRAQRAVQSALAADPGDEEVLAELERLAASNGGWSEAAETLASSLDAAVDLPAALRLDLWVRLAGWRRERLGDVRLAEEAYARALAIDPESLDVLRALEDLRRAPGRERDLVHTLRTRARLETDTLVKRDLLREAKALAEAPVADPGLAEATLRDLIGEDERDLWALEELTRLRSAAGDEAEVVALLIRRSEIVDDSRAAVSLRHEAARALVSKLDDVPRATALYEEILDGDPEDAGAATALRTLYVRGGRDRDLGKLLLRLIDGAHGARRAELRLELARLQADRFQAPEDAIETLRAVLDEEPTQADSVLLLSQLYELSARDAELAELLKAQLEAARGRRDSAAELSLLVRLAEVQERRLGDVSAAQQTYEQVLERDPYHRGALEAVARIAERRADWDRAAVALSRLLDFATDPSGVAWALRLAEARERGGDAAAVEDALQRGLKLQESNGPLRAMLRARLERAGKWAELADLLIGDADLVAESHDNGSDVSAVAADSFGAGTIPIRGSVPPQAPPVSSSVAQKVTLLKAAAQIHLERLHRPEQAIPILEQAARLVPYDRELLLSLCDAYSASRRDRDAAQVLERIIASFGSRRGKEIALYHHRLARTFTQLGDKSVALAQLDMAFKLDPSSIGVLRDLGVLAFETNDLERAQRTFRALLLQRLDSTAGISKGEVFYYLGEISAKQGDRAKAVQMFERAVENDPALERARTKLTELKG